MFNLITALDELTIPTAGTAVQIVPTAIQAHSISFEADNLNTGKIYIGRTDVDENNYITALAKGEQLELEAALLRGNSEVFILSDYFVDTETNGNTVHVSYQHSR